MTSNPLAMIMPINDLVCAPNSKTDFHNKPKKCIQLSHLRLSRIYLASLSIPNWLNGLVRSLKPRLFRLIPPPVHCHSILLLAIPGEGPESRNHLCRKSNAAFTRFRHLYHHVNGKPYLVPIIRGQNYV